MESYQNVSPLFFPVDNIDSLEEAKEVADLILHHNLEDVVGHFFSSLSNMKYLYLQELLSYFCDKMFEKKTPNIFFKVIDQVSQPGFELILDSVLRRILLPENGSFFSSVFKNKTPDFFLNYKHKIDQRNILHFAAEHSSKETVYDLSYKYKNLLNQRDVHGNIPLDLVIRRLNDPNNSVSFSIAFLERLVQLHPEQKIKLKQASLNAICQKGDLNFLKNVINNLKKFEFTKREQLDETAFDIILTKTTNNQFHYNKKFIHDIIENENFNSSFLNIHSFVSLFQRNDSNFIQIVFEKFKFIFPEIIQECRDKFRECVSFSGKNIECFEILYKFDSHKILFDDEILKNCLENQHIQVFLWLLDQFENVVLKNEFNGKEFEFDFLYRNIKWQTGKSSIFNILIEKCKLDNQFLAEAHLIFEKIFNLEEKISKINSEFLPHSLFFPASHADDMVLSNIEKSMIDVIYRAKFTNNIIKTIFSCLRNIKYSRLEECLNVFCTTMFDQKCYEYFFEIMEQIEKSNFTQLLESNLEKALNQTQIKFFESLFSNSSSSPLFFANYRQKSDKKNIIHLAIEKSNTDNILILAEIYKGLLTARDNQNLTPMDLLFQRLDLELDFLTKIIDLVEIGERKIELCQTTLISICKKNDEHFLETLISPNSKFKFLTNNELEESSLDIIIQSKSDKYIYGEKFIVDFVINNSNFDLILLNPVSLVTLFERNEETLIESLIFKANYQKLILNDLKRCTEIFVKKQNENIASVFYKYLKHVLSLFSDHMKISIDSIIYSIQYAISNELYIFANYLIRTGLNIIDSFELKLEDAILKNVLIPKNYDEKTITYLNSFPTSFDRIELTDNQNILHYVGQICSSDVFEYFFEKNKNSLVKFDILKYSPLDYLIQNMSTTNDKEDIKNNLEVLNRIVISYMSQSGCENLKLNHKSLISTCKLLINVPDNKILSLVDTLITKAVYNEEGDPKDHQNSSISCLISQKDTNGFWIFNNDFIEEKLVTLDEQFFSQYELSHESFEALCERRNNKDLMNKLTQNVKIKFFFNHNQKSFDKCFEFAMQNDNKEMTHALFDYFKKEVYKNDEHEFFSRLIYYIVKFIGESAQSLKAECNPKFAVFLIQYLNRLNNSPEFLRILKDALIKTILKLKKCRRIVEYLLDGFKLEEFIVLVDNENILHFAASNCDKDIIIDLFKNTDRYDYLSQRNKIHVTPLDILITRKVKQENESSSDFLITLINILKNYSKEAEEDLKGKLNDLVNKLESSESSKILSDTHQDMAKLVPCFNSESLRDLIEYLSKKSSNMTISFNSFKEICDRTDSPTDRDFLITYFLSRIERIYAKPTIAESTIHFLITKNISSDGQKTNKEFFFSSSNLKYFLREQPPNFICLINKKSLRELFKRKDVDLVRAILDKTDFEELQPLYLFCRCVKRVNTSNLYNISLSALLKYCRKEDTPFDILIKAKDDDDEFVFSAQVLRQIKKSSKIYKFKFNQSTFESLCERNDSNLLQIMKSRSKGFTRQESLIIFKKPIEKIIETSNTELVKILFDFIKNHNFQNTNSNTCENEELCENIKFAIDLSIQKKNIKIATCVLEYAESNELKKCYDNKCLHYCRIFNELFSHEKFIEHLLNEKRISLIFKNSAEMMLENKENILHLTAKKCQFETEENLISFKIFKNLFTVFKSSINKSRDYYETNSDLQTPLDIIVQKPKFLDEIESKILFKELIFKLPNELKLKLSMKSFETLCQKIAQFEDQNILISIIEKSEFYNTQYQSPIDILIKNCAYRDTLIPQIKPRSSVFAYELNHETFRELCRKSNPNLFKCLTNQSKFKQGLLSVGFLFDCVDIFVAKKEALNLKIVELFLDYIFDTESNQKSQPTAQFLFLVLNKIIEKSIAESNYKLTECVLDYFNVRVHEDPYPYEENINKYLIDHASLRKLKDDEAWKLIKKILDCSNLSKGSNELYCFNYLDFETFPYNLNIQHVDANKNAISTNPNTSIVQDTRDQMNDEEETSKLINIKHGYPSMNYKRGDSHLKLNSGAQKLSQTQILVPTDTVLILQEEKKRIVELEKHPLNWIGESGQKILKDHSVTLKLLKLKWDTHPFYFYLVITWLQLIYLLIFTSLVYKCFIDSEKETNEIIHYATKFIVCFIIFVVGIFLMCLLFLVIRNVIKPAVVCAIAITFSAVLILALFSKMIILTIFCQNITFFRVLWLSNFIFWVLNLAYEVIQFHFQKRSYFHSGKNIIEIINLVSNLIILFQLFDSIAFRENIMNAMKDIQTSFLFRIVYAFAPTCLLLRYITFVLCLEKLEKFGIYIVAYRKALKKSLHLAPIIGTMITGLIFSYKLNRVVPDKKFYNATILESVAQLSRTFLSNIESVDDLGITNGFLESISSFLLLIIFIIMIPTVLFNLLIGVSTGELTRILEVSDLTQYHMRLNFIIWTQKFLLKKYVQDCYKTEPFLKSIYRQSKKTSNKKKDLDFIEENSKQTNDNEMLLMRKEHEKQLDLLREDFLLMGRELRMEMNEKLQYFQDGLLETLNQNEKKKEQQLKEIDANSSQKLFYIATDIINKST